MKIKKLYFMITAILIMAFSPLHAQLKCELTDDPDKVRIICKDVDNFIQVLKHVRRNNEFNGILQKEYIDKATPGLKAYIDETDLTATDLANTVQRRLEDYQILANLPAELSRQENRIRDGLRNLKKLVPDARFMPVYIFIGPVAGSNAQPSEFGIMISIGRLDRDIRNLHLVVVHETVHVQNALKVGMAEYQSVLGGPKASLLGLVLREGVAYYFTLKSTGMHTHLRAYNYYVSREKELWGKFKEAMNGRSLEGWMFEKPSDPKQPHDVGYIIGYKIVEAYYDKAKDKKQAVQDILSIVDFPGFLKQSGYDEKIRDEGKNRML